MPGLTDISGLAAAASPDAWEGFARGEPDAPRHFAANIRRHETLSDAAFDAVTRSVGLAQQAGRSQVRVSAGELVHYLATNDGELGRLVPLNDGTGPRGALKRLANQSWVDSHLTEVESASPKGSGPVAGWGKGPAVRREVAVARKSRAARGELLKYRLRHPKSFLVTHAGRDGARAPRGLLAFCECLGLGHVKDGDELFELRIDLRPGLKFKYWRPTIFDVLRTRDAYDCFPDWLARQDPTTKAPCGLTRHLKTGRPCLPELIVDLEDGAELEVIPRGTLKQTPGRAYLRLDPDP